MARPLTATAGGRTNRRFLLLALFAAGISAVFVYAAVSQRTGEEGGGGGAVTTVPAVVAKVDIPARTQVTASMIELRDMPASGRSDLAYTDLSQVVGKVTRFPVATHEQVLSSKLVSLTGPATQTTDSLSFVIPKGMRGISITVDQVISAGGLVLPGDYVDIIGVFKASFGAGDSQQEEEAYFARTILQNVEVLAVAQTVVNAPPDALNAESPTPTTGGQRERATEADPNPKAATVTMAVTQEQAQLIFLAELNGKLRLSVRPYGEDAMPDVPFIAQPSLIPPGLPSPP